MQNYKQFEISTKPFNSEILTSIIWELEILGVNEFDNYIAIFVYENSPLNKRAIEDILNKAVQENLFTSFQIEEKLLPAINWNKEWEKKINVIEVSDRIVIKPTFRNYEAKENQIIITIDPKMSFGTGEHETTRIILCLLEKHLKKDVTVLDVGSGTAILSIAATKLGANNVLAIDNDEWCFVNGKENILKNNVKNVTVAHNTIENIQENDFDMVIANINKNVLLNIRTELLNKCKKGGIIILSGILFSDEAEIKRQFTQIGLTALDKKQINEWIGIVFQKL